MAKVEPSSCIGGRQGHHFCFNAPAHCIYKPVGTTISFGELAKVACSWLPDVRSGFEWESGVREPNSAYLPDDSRLVSEVGIRFRPHPCQVLQVINDTRRRADMSPSGEAG